MPSASIPATIRANAWMGSGTASGALSPEWSNWARRGTDVMQTELRARPADPRDHLDERVGWGVVLPEDISLSPSDNAAAVDAPEPIRELLAAREGIVLRYAPTPGRGWSLRRHHADRSVETIPVAGDVSEGRGPGQLPRYLLLFGSPAELPWRLQYVLNCGRCVGRIDLTGDALARYVDAALNDWADAASRPERALVWSVDLGGSDITHLLADAIGRKLSDALSVDDELTVDFLTNARATESALIGKLAGNSPALIATTSHGLGTTTGGVADREQLGLPVDRDGRAVTPARLLQGWQPDGAVWFAHACCSAGTDDQTTFAGLFEPTSELADLVDGIARLGPSVSTLSYELLGATRPARAFIGQVEPTFDWTVENPRTRRYETDDFVRRMYEALFQERPVPIGMAFRAWFEPIGGWAIAHDAEVSRHDREGEPLEYAAWCRLAMRDRSSTVIMGDPCVVPAALGAVDG